AAASGSPAPTVQWQVSPNGVNWSNVSGATSTTLTVTKPSVSQSGNKYRAVFTNTCGGTQTATSNAGTLTVTPRPITVTADPKTKVYGDSDPALTYQVTSRSLVAGDGFSGALTRVAGETVEIGREASREGALTAGGKV